MPRLNWPASLTPRTFWADDQLERRCAELRRYVIRKAVPVTPVRFHRGDLPEARHPAFDDAALPIIAPGEAWAQGPDELAWFRASVTVPAELAGKRLALRFGTAVAHGGGDNQAEALLYLEGRPYHGLDRNHQVAFLPPHLTEAGSFPIAVQAWSGRARWQDLRWQDPDLVWVDAATEALVHDLDVLYRTVQTMETGSPHRIALVALGERVMAALDWTYPGSDRFYQSVRTARAIAAAGLEDLKGLDGLKPTVTHVGHTHLDVAWLWTLENVRLKTARSWSTALRLMEEYPEFRWFQSQPQLYRYIKERFPEVWKQVKRRVADGRWEADGGMWVEADCNLPSGESLVRQFLHGIRFFREELGVRCRVLWLPDVFGYSWALPQIMRGCGLRYFMTTKIAWSQFNRFPYDTFRWRGIDGTEVLTHFITTPVHKAPPEYWFYNYNGEVYPDTVKGNWEMYQQKELNAETLSSFGFGDGGGGPTREQMEFIRRLADMPGIPRVRMGSVRDFFQRLEERVGADPRLPVWNGELYLEYHRGTYTSQARQKRLNRKAEFLLHNAELYAGAAAALTGAAYPAAALTEAWEIVLRNQFHDIIPGSSIPEVYEESAQEYERAFDLGGRALEGALEALAGAVDLPEPALMVFNPVGVDRSDYVEADLPEGLVPVDEQGEPLPVQGRLLYAPGVPANGFRTFSLRRIERPAPSGPLTVSERLLETPHLRIELNERGQISRLYDKRHRREVLPPGRCANVLQAFEDKPLRWDAWDIDIYYQQKGREVDDLIEAAVEEAGPERGVLRLTWRFEGSRITQRMAVYARTPRIDFVTHVDWQQSQVLLKAAFPVEVHATRATYEVQFGSVERPTHWNTSWDWARFETVGHKWVDLSEGGYGVSLLNDCKYGHDIKDGVMRLTLIKSGTWPDPTADRGDHHFTYSLYPHEGDWYAGGTPAQAYGLNNPLLARCESAHPGPLPDRLSLVRCTAPHVMVETVKRAESGDGLVVRLYEYGNRRGPAELHFCRPVAAAFETNLLEEEPRPAACAANRVTFAIKPFEIKTFVVQLA